MYSLTLKNLPPDLFSSSRLGLNSFKCTSQIQLMQPDLEDHIYLVRNCNWVILDKVILRCKGAQDSLAANKTYVNFMF
jgi:hypothetical protein